jgi:hypothetical protein
VTSGFLMAGALRVVLHHELPAPQWFNLAWWGFRTFMTFEKETPTDAAGSPAAPLSNAETPAAT